MQGHHREEKQVNLKVLKLGKNGSIVKWVKSLCLYLILVIGVRNFPLFYIIGNKQDVLGAKHSNALLLKPTILK